MGTRGLLGFVIKGKRLGAYNNHDSYPTGLGLAVAQFIARLKPEDHAAMITLIKEITWVENGAPSSPGPQAKYPKLQHSDIGDNYQLLQNWYYRMRKVDGVKALPAIDEGLEHMIDYIRFLDDDLWCEWSYFIDFENSKLEVWSSGNLMAEASFDTLREEGMEYMEELEKLKNGEE